MNVSGMIRGYMSKSFSGEKFLLTVAKTMENQLKEWDSGYELVIWKLQTYEIIVQNGEKESYLVKVGKEELEYLKNRSPFSLDYKIWSELREQGLKIIKGKGNYIDIVFYKKKI